MIAAELRASAEGQACGASWQSHCLHHAEPTAASDRSFRRCRAWAPSAMMRILRPA